MRYRVDYRVFNNPPNCDSAMKLTCDNEEQAKEAVRSNVHKSWGHENFIILSIKQI